MPGVAIGIAPGTAPQAEETAAIRVAAISATESFLIAPHQSLGAVALHLIQGNGADTSTPLDSVGGSFGAARIQGMRLLPSVSSNPLTQASEIIYRGSGSQQIAVNVANKWAGQFHGFGMGAAYTQAAPNLAVSATIPAAVIASSGDMIWSGASGSWADSITLNADGSIATSASVTLGADPLQAYLDMTIVNAGFIRASLDGGTSWIDLLDLSHSFGTLAANVASVIMRNPRTGTTVTITDDALNGTPGRAKVIMRRPSATPNDIDPVKRTGDFKIYPDLNPLPPGTHLGTVAVNRTIVFGATAPDPTVTLSAAIVQNEGDQGATDFSYTVTRSAAIGAVSVAWTFAAGTTQASDFVGGSYPAGGSVAFADGQANASFTVQVEGDVIVEANESFAVAIRAPIGYAPGAAMSATGTILNDDSGDPGYIWDGASAGDSVAQTNWNPLMRSWDNAARQYVFSRSGGGYSSGNHRSLFPMNGLTPGQVYRMTITGSISGTSASAGVTMVVSADGVNGSGGTSSATMSASYASGATPYQFTATATTMYLVIQQGFAAGTDNVFRLSRLSQLSAI